MRILIVLTSKLPIVADTTFIGEKVGKIQSSAVLIATGWYWSLWQWFGTNLPRFNMIWAIQAWFSQIRCISPPVPQLTGMVHYGCWRLACTSFKSLNEKQSKIQNFQQHQFTCLSMFHFYKFIKSFHKQLNKHILISCTGFFGWFMLPCFFVSLHQIENTWRIPKGIGFPCLLRMDLSLLQVHSCSLPKPYFNRFIRCVESLLQNLKGLNLFQLFFFMLVRIFFFLCMMKIWLSWRDTSSGFWYIQYSWYK